MVTWNRLDSSVTVISGQSQIKNSACSTTLVPICGLEYVPFVTSGSLLDAKNPGGHCDPNPSASHPSRVYFHGLLRNRATKMLAFSYGGNSKSFGKNRTCYSRGVEHKPSLQDNEMSYFSYHGHELGPRDRHPHREIATLLSHWWNPGHMKHRLYQSNTRREFR